MGEQYDDSASPANIRRARPTIHLPTSAWRPGKPALLARTTGVLRGAPDVNGEYRVWIETAGVKTHVIWPAGFVARLDPLEIMDAEGSVVAREGDLIEVGGGARGVKRATESVLGESGVFIVHSRPVVLGRRD